MLHFIHDLDSEEIDLRAQPGADMNFYLHSVKARAKRYLSIIIHCLEADQ